MSKKYMVSAAMGAGMVLMSVVPAFAADNCRNLITGALSSNICSKFTTTKARVNLTNGAMVFNDVNTKSTTGNNEQNKNVIGVTGITTESAKTNVAVGTTGNVNEVKVDQTKAIPAAATGGNSFTGYKSGNIVTVIDVKKVNVSVSNEAFVTNKITTSANSGHNEENQNVVAGGIDAGPASSTVIVETGVNSNTVTVNQ